MEEELVRKWAEEVAQAPQTEFSKKIGKRIADLIKLDPLSLTLSDSIKKSLSHLKSLKCALNDKMHLTVDDFILTYNEEIPKKIRETAKVIEKKWHCQIYTTVSRPGAGHPIHDLWGINFFLPAPVETLIMPDKHGYWHLPEAVPIFKIPIFINVAVINKKDASLVKNLVWKTVLRYREKMKDSLVEIVPIVRGDGMELFHERDLMFLFHMRERTFHDYIKWYDIHTKEKLSFRLIAHIDRISRTNPAKAAEALEELKHRKIRWGQPVRGEDKVEKGIKLIYKAIHRTDYTQKKIKPVIDEYKCPNHGNDCPPSCGYYKKWLDRFNRLMPSA